ncbi:1716_t:CDS:2 [Funneliformis caledonium]|uniref:1716_t:CDS:1 n=1 Tax=Funneliformis caledonium TaxID=1117310 RepID=A0A9N9E7C5_9GLOM|nr:1716_t:CDS:2 [Funneliformis caledonium]
MAAEARKALEALMGAEALGGVPDHMKYDDEKKMDLGACPKIHSERLKSEYEEAKKRKECDYEAEFERNLATFVAECDRKIASAQKRLDKTPEDSAKVTQLMKEIENLATEISELTKEVEVLGEEGKVTESMKLLQDVEDKKALKIEKEKEHKNSAEGNGPSQQQKLRVCEVCSAYLSIFDSDRRLADHFGGKMHLGYLKIRELLKELKEKNKDRGGDSKDGRSYHDRGDRDRDRGYERDRHRDYRVTDVHTRDVHDQSHQIDDITEGVHVVQQGGGIETSNEHNS